MAASGKHPLSPGYLDSSRRKWEPEQKKFKYDCGSSTERNLKDYGTFNRYLDQFEELSKIGYGAFGVVFKSRHLIDRVIYAVKKVPIKTLDCRKILDEVRIMAPLRHPNLVDYKQAWIEPYNGFEGFSSLQSSQACSQTSTTSLSFIRKGIENVKIMSKERNIGDNESRANTGALENPHEIEPHCVLYIQMRLYQRNLREWMDDRPRKPSSSSKINTIAAQILSGINYIHSREVVHHDINPQNIFISLGPGTISVQLGDFGLACHRQKHDEFLSTGHSQEIGTSVYMAPEQLEKKCDSKSDIYSFGIVLFELLHPVQITDKEKDFRASDGKKIKIPSAIEKRYPNWVPLLKRTLCPNPTRRPSAVKLLKDVLSIINITKEKPSITKLEEEI